MASRPQACPAPPPPPPTAEAFAEAFERLVAKVAASLSPERIAALHAAFEARTGAFGPEDAWFESRSRAFWDDTMTRQGVAAEVLGETGDVWAGALTRSHRGLFQTRAPSQGSSTSPSGVVLSDLWSGAELLVQELDPASRDALAAPSGPFDGTVVAATEPARLALLPGAIFHPEEAEPAIAEVLSAARARALGTGPVLDGLLRMELSLRSLSRVKPSYAYRPDALREAP